jgi:hypothetical protein
MQRHPEDLSAHVAWNQLAGHLEHHRMKVYSVARVWWHPQQPEKWSEMNRIECEKQRTQAALHSFNFLLLRPRCSPLAFM